MWAVTYVIWNYILSLMVIYDHKNGAQEYSWGGSTYYITLWRGKVYTGFGTGCFECALHAKDIRKGIDKVMYSNDSRLNWEHGNTDSEDWGDFFLLQGYFAISFFFCYYMSINSEEFLRWYSKSCITVLAWKWKQKQLTKHLLLRIVITGWTTFKKSIMDTHIWS